MNDRYIKPLRTHTLPNGTKVYRPEILKTIETDLFDIQVDVSDSDRLDIISHNVYGSSAHWWKLRAANNRRSPSIYASVDTLIIPSVF